MSPKRHTTGVQRCHLFVWLVCSFDSNLMRKALISRFLMFLSLLGLPTFLSGKRVVFEASSEESCACGCVASAFTTVILHPGLWTATRHTSARSSNGPQSEKCTNIDSSYHAVAFQDEMVRSPWWRHARKCTSIPNLMKASQYKEFCRRPMSKVAGMRTFWCKAKQRWLHIDVQQPIGRRYNTQCHDSEGTRKIVSVWRSTLDTML